MKSAAFAFFLLTCLQTAFKAPDLSLLPYQRANDFSALLCAGALLLALPAEGRNRLRLKSPDVVISLVLTILIFASAAMSATPDLCLIRGFVVAASALGGYWCARLLLDSPAERYFFLWFCVGILAVLIVLAALGVVLRGRIDSLVDHHWHPFADRFLLLSFAPLTLVASGRASKSAIGIALLVLSYVVLLLCAVMDKIQTVALVPVAVLPAAFCLHKWTRKGLIALSVLLFLTAVCGANHIAHHTEKVSKGHISVDYRAENIYFSRHIAAMNPLLGIGLWAPREPYLEGYETHWPGLTKEQFAKWTAELRTSESTFFTFLADLGIPFVIIYYGSLAILLFRLVAAASEQSHAGAVIPPLPLLLALLGTVLHLQIYDGLFQPQVSWFFHILLGLIPSGPARWSQLFGALRSAGWRIGVFGIVT
ncbi:MAG: hypothetical protein V2B18_15855, partial [Pseudomonadota bacterium]